MGILFEKKNFLRSQCNFKTTTTKTKMTLFCDSEDVFHNISCCEQQMKMFVTSLNIFHLFSFTVPRQPLFHSAYKWLLCLKQISCQTVAIFFFCVGSNFYFAWWMGQHEIMSLNLMCIATWNWCLFVTHSHVKKGIARWPSCCFSYINLLNVSVGYLIYLWNVTGTMALHSHVQKNGREFITPRNFTCWNHAHGIMLV